jgi:hypothetical protein
MVLCELLKERRERERERERDRETQRDTKANIEKFFRSDCKVDIPK